MNLQANKRLLIIGNQGGTNVGDSFLRAARKLGLDVRLMEMSAAMRAPVPLRRFNWWVRGRRPTWMAKFGKQVVETIGESRPTWLLATGTAPLSKKVLEEVGRLGVVRINYLTDDPWNPAHKAPWFLNALPSYDHIFSPRRSNINDLRQRGCSGVTYLPFAYDEDLFPPWLQHSNDDSSDASPDLVFGGGADPDRVSCMTTLIKNGFKIALYGDYWERFPATRALSRGHASPDRLRKAIAGAKVALCLVRRANRDGHCMRTFEIPAVGACMLVEDTDEHREIFGKDQEAVVYFANLSELVEKTRWLLQKTQERRRLAKASHQLIVNNGNTYRDRLNAMLC